MARPLLPTVVRADELPAAAPAKPKHRRLLSDRWPATGLALRRQKQNKLRISAVTAGLAALQWFLFYLEIPACYTIPLYIASWIVPAVVVAQTARDVDTGLWDESRYSCLSTLDLWWSRLYAPIAPWSASLLTLSIPVLLRPYLPGGRDPVPDFRLGEVNLYVSDGAVVSFVLGVQACAFAYGALALCMTLRTRQFRAALVATYLVSAATSYTALAFHIVSPVIGDWANMPAITWIFWKEPWAILAPPWMVGGTIYNIRTHFVSTHIVAVTAIAFTAAALFTAVLSYRMVQRQRWPDQTRGRQE
jgi:hypothetical protein